MTIPEVLQLIPAKYRKYAIYAPFAVIGLILGALKVALPEVEWINVALAVYAFVGAAFGTTANTNTHVVPTQPEDVPLGD